MVGRAGCNRYGVNVEIKDGAMVVDYRSLFMTQGLCLDEGLMKQEEKYIETFRTVTAYRLSGKRLEMKNERGEVVLVFEKGLQ